MKIVNLKAENIKKIKAVDITPTDNTVVISGKNGQGKSSVLDSILFALGGRDALKNTPKPIREGQESASVDIDLGDYRVVRTFNTNGTTKLEVISKEGAKYSSPQTMLDEIVGRISFDPLAFANMKPAEQRSILLDVLGLTKDVDLLQQHYRSKYELRTFVGRELKTAEGHAASIEVPTNAPQEPVDTVKVASQLRDAEAQNRTIEETEDALHDAENDIIELKAQLREAQKVLADAKKALEGKSKVDTQPMQDKLADAGLLNRAYELAQQKQQAEAIVAKKKAEQKDLTKEMEEIASKKDELIESAKLPIEGLNIDAEGVTFNNMPFTQLSSAEQLKVSLAIAMAMNPKLRVMRIMDGSLLDKDNLAVVSEMAKAEDYQVWIERVEDTGTVGILIEDGEVKHHIDTEGMQA